MKIDYDRTGNERKELVAKIAELTGEKPVYMRTPTYAYKIGPFEVSRYGVFSWEDRADNLSDEAYSNLEKIIVSKQTLMRHAFRSKGISVARKNGQIIFSGFNASDGDHTGAYLRYITLLTKFAFCCFIIRIGMIGAEYKKARKILLENLTGNSSWKNGAPEKATNVENPAEGSASTETVEETEAAINDGMV